MIIWTAMILIWRTVLPCVVNMPGRNGTVVYVRFTGTHEKCEVRFDRRI